MAQFINKQEYCSKCTHTGKLKEKCHFCFCMNFGDVPSGYQPVSAQMHSDKTVKDDVGKPKLLLVPTRIIYDIAEVREWATKNKYKDPNSWRKVEVEQYVEATYRHLLEIINDPTSVAKDSGIPHHKHIACNIAFICEIMATTIEAGSGNEKQKSNNERV